MESNRWLVVAFLAGGLLIGVAGYAVGLSQGAAHAAVATAANVDASDIHWGWNHWHGAVFPFGPILAIFFWVWILRALFWGLRGPWGWRRWRYYDYHYDEPRRFEEWHRRAHEADNRKS